MTDLLAQAKAEVADLHPLMLADLHSRGVATAMLETPGWELCFGEGDIWLASETDRHDVTEIVLDIIDAARRLVGA